MPCWKVAPLLRIGAAGIALFFATAGCARDFSIESRDLAPLPEAAVIKIKSAKGSEAFGHCQLVGKAIQLATSVASAHWVATTASACGWSAARGPIWIVSLDASATQPLLRTHSYDLTVGRNAQHGLRHIATATGTAGYREESLWKFNGKHYVLNHRTRHSSQP